MGGRPPRPPTAAFTVFAAVESPGRASRTDKTYWKMARALIDFGDRVAVAMVVDSKRSAPRPLGLRRGDRERRDARHRSSAAASRADVVLRAQEVLASGVPRARLPYGITDDDVFDVGLPCGGEIENFIQALDPGGGLDRRPPCACRRAPVGHHRAERPRDAGSEDYGEGRAALAAGRTAPDALGRALRPGAADAAFGAVDTAQAPCRIARQVGSHRSYPMRAPSSHPGAAAGCRRDRGRLAGDGLRRSTPDEATYVVVLTHDARFDEPALGPALRSSAPYIGALGSRRAQEKRRTRLLNAGYSESEIDRISGPLGLDIGAVTPAETAVSILAEVLAVRSHRDGGRLPALEAPSTRRLSPAHGENRADRGHPRNLVALDAVLSDIERRHVDRVVCRRCGRDRPQPLRRSTRIAGSAAMS